MEVIFIKDLKNQGKKGQIKQVKDGYAENFLIKKGYAVIKNKENLAKLQHEQDIKIQQDKEAKDKAKIIKEKIEKETLEFKVKTGEQDRVFGSVSIKQIKDQLEKKGYNIEKSQIDIPNPIAALGFHNINIKLYPEITAKVKIHVIK